MDSTKPSKSARPNAKATGTKPKEPAKVVQPKPAPIVPIVPAAKPRASSTVKSVMDIFYSSDVLQKMYAERCVALLSDFIKGNGPYPKAINTLADIADFVVIQRNFKMASGNTLCEEFFLATFANLSTDKRKKKEKESFQSDKADGKSDPPLKKLNSTEISQGKIFPLPAKPGKANIRSQPNVKIFTEVLATCHRFLEYFPNPRQQTFSSNGGLHPVTDCVLCAGFGFYNASDATGKKRLLTVPQKIYIAKLHTLVNPDGRVLDWNGFDDYLNTKDSTPLDAPSTPVALPTGDDDMLTDEITLHPDDGDGTPWHEVA